MSSPPYSPSQTGRAINIGEVGIADRPSSLLTGFCVFLTTKKETQARLLHGQNVASDPRCHPIMCSQE